MEIKFVPDVAMLSKCCQLPMLFPMFVYVIHIPNVVLPYFAICCQMPNVDKCCVVICPKLPNVAKCCQMLPNVAKCCQMLPNCCQMLCCHMLPNVAKLLPNVAMFRVCDSYTYRVRLNFDGEGIISLFS